MGAPGGGERSGLGLAVADDARDQQPRVVERGAVRVGQGVAQLTALVHGAGGLRGDMAGHSAGEGELPEQPPHAGLVPAHVRIRVAVAAVQPGVGEDRGASVARAPDAQGAQITLLDHAVEVGVDEVEAGRGAPVPEQPGLDVLGPQRLPQQRVAHQVDLSGGQVVGGAPVCVECREFPGARRGTVRALDLAHDCLHNVDAEQGC